MGFFSFLENKDINQGINDFRKVPGAVLLDVRTPQEYMDGHIPGSKNVPLQELDKVSLVVKTKGEPLYVYCRSGNRSGQAKKLLESMGYTNVNDIGGIISYSGTIEK